MLMVMVFFMMMVGVSHVSMILMTMVVIAMVVVAACVVTVMVEMVIFGDVISREDGEMGGKGCEGGVMHG